MKKALIAVHSPKTSKELLKLFKELVYVPESVVLLHVEQLEGNAMMTAMLGDAEMSTLKESLRVQSIKRNWTGKRNRYWIITGRNWKTAV